MARTIHSLASPELGRLPVFDRSKRASDQVYAWLRGAILSLRLTPGTPISEVDIGGMASLSRTPVREALKRLEQEQLVVTYPSLGSFVSKISLQQIEESVVIRRLLEGEAAARAAESHHEAVSRSLDAVVAEQRLAVDEGDVAGVYLADEEFHRLLFAGVGYQLMWTSVRQARTSMQRLRGLTIQKAENRAAALQHHIDIAEAIRARDPERARTIMASHAQSNWLFLDSIPVEKRHYIDCDLHPGPHRTQDRLPAWANGDTSHVTS